MPSTPSTLPSRRLWLRIELAAVDEGRGREVAVVAREAILDRAAEGGLVARGGDLLVVGQARGVAIDRLGHAERARLARHQPGELVFVAGDGFCDHDGGVVGRAGDETLDGILDPDASGRAAGRAWSAPARRRARRPSISVSSFILPDSRRSNSR